MPEATPQRRWRAACPNCGAPVEFASRASASAVCGFCRSTLLRERGDSGETLSQIGQSAEVFEDYSPLQIGSTGQWMGSGFAVVGRLQMQGSEGHWNEWHLLFDGGGDPPKVAWLSEDNGSFVLSLEVPLQEAAPDPARLQPGLPLSLAGQRWSVAAVTPTRIAAAQGELPRPPQLRESFPVVELRNERDEVASLEWSSPGAPSFSIGRAVTLAELRLQNLRVAATGESVSEASIQGRSFACPSCGAPLAPKLAQTKSLACGQCGAVVDVPAPEAKALGFTDQPPGAEPLIPLGRTGQLSVDPSRPAQPWQVVGYQERCDLPDDAEDEQTFWREYLLFNQMEGFAFLVDTQEGWSLVKPLTGAPSTGPGGVARWAGTSFKPRWEQPYRAKVTHVLGEFYWPVRLEQEARVTDYVSGDGRQLLSREATRDEVTWSHGRVLPAEEVRRAFSLPQQAAPTLQRDASAFSKSGISFFTVIVVSLLILLILVLVMRALSRDSCQSYKDSFGEFSNEYQQCRSSLARPSGSGYGGSWGGYSSGGGGHK